MKYILPYFLTGVLICLVGCEAKQGVKWEFSPGTPFSSLVRDEREIKLYCEICKEEVNYLDTLHPGCNTTLTVPESVPCEYCLSSGFCEVCRIFRMEGKCRFCKGSGKLAPDKTCFNCRGSGRCHLCDGSTKCDFCGGTGRYKLGKAS
jgi:hypothetical protein